MNDLLKQLQALIPLAAAATAGPWEVIPNSEHTDSVHSTEANHVENFGLGEFRSSNLCMNTGGFAHNSDAALIVAARNVLTPENLLALCAALTAEAAPVAGWVSIATPPMPCDTLNGPAPFSPDVLLWLNDNEAPVVGYYDYRAGYDCYQAYGLGIVDSATHWTLIVSPAAPAPMKGAQPNA